MSIQVRCCVLAKGITLIDHLVDNVKELCCPCFCFHGLPIFRRNLHCLCASEPESIGGQTFCQRQQGRYAQRELPRFVSGECVTHDRLSFLQIWHSPPIID